MSQWQTPSSVSRARLRREIIQTASRLELENGSQVTVKSVAAAMGILPRVIYTYFDGIDSLRAAAGEARYQAATDFNDVPLQSTPTWMTPETASLSAGPTSARNLNF